MEDILHKIKNAVESQDSKLMRRLALDFEGELLDKPTFPKEYFDILMQLFSDDKFCSSYGSDQFIWIIYNDFEKLSSDQSEILFKYFTGDFGKFKNQELLHSIADFIARKYSPKVTLKAFREASIREGKSDRYASLVGFEILSVNKKTTDKEKSMAINLINQMGNS
jgi:hypothetical protein